MNYTQGLRLAKKLGLKVVEDLKPDDIAQGVCVFWEHKVRLREDLEECRKVHVLLHEIAHYTGASHLLDRETLYKYSNHELYALVEETIAEASTIALGMTLDLALDLRAFNYLVRSSEKEGIEYELDILPEVLRVLELMNPIIKGVMTDA